MTGQVPDDAITASGADLFPLDRLALHMAKEQIMRGENPPMNTTATLVAALERITAALSGLTGAITAQAAAAEREAIIARLRRLDILWGRRGWLANAADLIELHPDHGLLGGAADGAHPPGGAT